MPSYISGSGFVGEMQGTTTQSPNWADSSMRGIMLRDIIVSLQSQYCNVARTMPSQYALDEGHAVGGSIYCLP